jgi:hypothetical protein
MGESPCQLLEVEFHAMQLLAICAEADFALLPHLRKRAKKNQFARVRRWESKSPITGLSELADPTNANEQRPSVLEDGQPPRPP